MKIYEHLCKTQRGGTVNWRNLFENYRKIHHHPTFRLKSNQKRSWQVQPANSLHYHQLRLLHRPHKVEMSWYQLGFFCQNNDLITWGLRIYYFSSYLLYILLTLHVCAWSYNKLHNLFCKNSSKLHSGTLNAAGKVARSCSDQCLDLFADTWAILKQLRLYQIDGRPQLLEEKQLVSRQILSWAGAINQKGKSVVVVVVVVDFF